MICSPTSCWNHVRSRVLALQHTTRTSAIGGNRHGPETSPLKTQCSYIPTLRSLVIKHPVECQIESPERDSPRPRAIYAPKSTEGGPAGSA